MELLFWILVATGFLLGFFYLVLIASYCYAWLKTKNNNCVPDSSVFVSVIVAARNEEDALTSCIEAILAQNYPKDNFEIILIDDHSDDSTLQIIRNYSEKYPLIRCVELSKNVVGKKNAIHAAVGIVKGELIVTTDADCEMGAEWLATIVSFYKQFNPKMIVGAVAYHKEKTLFEKMQSLEFMALMACAGASLFYNKAIMCNGANLAYSKNAFLEVGGFDEIDKKASGDDVLLMYKIKDKYPGKVLFLKNKGSIVYTKAKNTLKQFIQQRKRWASKGFSDLNTETKKVSLLIYLFNFYLLFVPLFGGVCLANSPFYPLFIKISLILIGIKCFIDFLLLFLSASFFQKKRYLLFYLPEQIVYMIYIVVIVFVASIGKYEWKGRRTN